MAELCCVAAAGGPAMILPGDELLGSALQQRHSVLASCPSVNDRTSSLHSKWQMPGKADREGPGPGRAVQVERYRWRRSLELVLGRFESN